MTLDRFNWDTLRLEVRFEALEIDAESMLRGLKDLGHTKGPNAEGILIASLDFFGSDPDAYAGHIRIRLREDRSGRAEITYHSGKPKKKTKSLSLESEDGAQWFGRFLNQPLSTHLHVNYSFDQSYSSVIPLPFPLTTNEKGLAGALVSGLAIILPNQMSRTAIIQIISNETFIFLRDSFQVDLKSFEIEKQLDSLSEVVASLVRKKTQ